MLDLSFLQGHLLIDTMMLESRKAPLIMRLSDKLFVSLIISHILKIIIKSYSKIYLLKIESNMGLKQDLLTYFMMFLFLCRVVIFLRCETPRSHHSVLKKHC